MMRTCEMRWFFTQPPVDLEKLDANHAEIQERTDWYHMPPNPGCGIKLREGLMEIKLRSATYGERRFDPFCGRLEMWKKWSLSFDGDKPPSLEELAGNRWIDLDKKRCLFRFEVDGELVRPTGERPVSGCEFEVTELQLEGQTHWTVGFEAGGDILRLESNLQAVCRAIGERRALLQPFTLDRSLGYAEWLCQQAPQLR